MNKLIQQFKLIIISILIFGCGSSSSSNSTTQDSSQLDKQAKYKIVFQIQWDTDSFSTNFPSNRHFSGLIGGTHNKETTIWANGSLASAGIEEMAETGAKTILLQELEAIQLQGNLESIISEGGISSSTENVTIEISASSDFSMLTLVSMVAPSPDWFVGIQGIQLIENNNWIEEKVINLVVYDAGTDEGTTFSSTNIDNATKENISILSSSRSDTDFENGIHFNSGIYIGTFTITKINE
ncbi:MAG: hypothetical protein COA79_15510 [Planctomycetota bacterium]|nr:MAG: hypothetical protein COA79_15510 [Planctomycetota bacterium]